MRQEHGVELKQVSSSSVASGPPGHAEGLEPRRAQPPVEAPLFFSSRSRLIKSNVLPGVEDCYSHGGALMVQDEEVQIAMQELLMTVDTVRKRVEARQSVPRGPDVSKSARTTRKLESNGHRADLRDPRPGAGNRLDASGRAEATRRKSS